MEQQKIEYKTEKIGERRVSEVSICSSKMTEKQGIKIIDVLNKSGFYDAHLSPEQNFVCVKARVLETFKE